MVHGLSPTAGSTQNFLTDYFISKIVLAFVARGRVYLGSSGTEALRGFPLYAVYVVHRRVVTVLLPCELSC